MDEFKITGGDLPISLEMHWIDCKDQLPVDDDVIVVLIGRTPFICYRQKYPAYYSRVDDFNYSTREFVSLNSDGNYKTESYFNGWLLPSHIKEPTHWFPLPKIREVKK